MVSRRVAWSPTKILILVLVAAAMLTIWAMQPSDRSRSDGFWQALAIRGLDAEHYDDVASLYRAADLVVVARFAELSTGRQVVDNGSVVSFAHATLEVERAVKSSADSSRIILQLLLPDGADVDALRGSLPLERGLFFLRDMEQKAVALGYPPTVTREVKGIWDLVVSRSVIRDVDGRAAAVDGAPDYISALNGELFESLQLDR